MWTKKGIEHYHGRCEGWICTQIENERIWGEIENKVKDSIKKIEKKITTCKLGKMEWYNEGWKKKKES